MNRHRFAIAAAALALAAPSHAQSITGPGVSRLDLVQVTANRFAEPVQEVPNSIEVITAEDMRARGVSDLRTALALLGGVSVASGGDDGPAGAVPGLLGLREVDDFLLLVDGVPSGGAFIPQFATLDLSDVERIEVQRGPAPVLYGTTSFAGTINLIHYGAGKAARRADLAYGSFGSYQGGASAVLAQGRFNASIAADGSRERYSDPHSGLDRGHVLLRTGGDLAGGEARLDLDAVVQHQKPASPRPLQGAVFDPETPIDFNQNPADGKIDTNRFQLTGAYDKNIAPGSWGTTLSLTQTHTQLVQGFFNADDAGSPGGAAAGNATGFHQKRDLGEAYFDTHLTHRFGSDVLTTFGASELFGMAHQGSQTFSYTVPGDGSLPQSSGEGTPGDAAYLSDQRSFAGIYAQTRWNITPRLGLLGGLRLNHTDERRSNGDGNDAQTQRASTTRFTGSLGANWRVWQDAESDLDDVVIYADYGNSFQPPQIDFGPDVGGPLLRPEAERSYEAGVKADGFDGRFDADLSLFYVDFDNQAIATQSGGVPSLANGGRERYKGAELELKYRFTQRLTMSANYSYNDARYRDFSTVIGGTQVQLAGNRLLLSPRGLAGLGLVYGGGQGMQASLVGNYVGGRYLDMENTITAKSYTTLDGTLGYAFRGYTLSLNGYNLSNRRDPVLASELGEGQFYLYPGRRVFVKLSAAL